MVNFISIDTSVLHQRLFIWTFWHSSLTWVNGAYLDLLNIEIHMLTEMAITSPNSPVSTVNLWWHNWNLASHCSSLYRAFVHTKRDSSPCFFPAHHLLSTFLRRPGSASKSLKPWRHCFPYRKILKLILVLQVFQSSTRKIYLRLFTTQSIRLSCLVWDGTPSPLVLYFYGDMRNQGTTFILPTLHLWII